MTSPFRKKLETILSEVTPDDFGAGDHATNMQNREEEEITTAGGSGSRTRASARRWIKGKLATLASFVDDPERDGAFDVEFINLLNWVDAVYQDTDGYKSVVHTYKYILAKNEPTPNKGPR